MTFEDGSLRLAGRDLFHRLDASLSRNKANLEAMEIGLVASVGGGVAHVTGFTDLGADELLRFPRGIVGLAANIYGC